MSNRYWCKSLTGGVSGSLDNLDPLDMDDTDTGLILVVGDICDVTDSINDKLYWYVAKFASGKSESSPDLIIPDNNPSNWYWELVTSTDGILATAGSAAKKYALILG